MTLEIGAPSSKSMTQRALMLAALTPGTTRIYAPLVCDDSRYLTDLLRALGARITWHEGYAEVKAQPLHAPPDPVFCGNAGTAVRFGSCLALLLDGPLAIDGDKHMRRRPIGALGDALHNMGVAVRYLESAGCPPLHLERQRSAPEQVTVDASKSSQYASGLLMVAPRLPRGLDVELIGPIVSQPYLAMTIAMMRRAGIGVTQPEEDHILVPAGTYGSLPAIAVEADWSGAAFLLAAAHILKFDIDIPHLARPEQSLQGDAAFTAMVRDIDAGADQLDLTDVPDLIAPLTAVALFADHPVRFRGAAHTRIKECDRVAVLCRELRKIGAEMTEHEDGLDVAPLTDPRPGPHVLDPEDDHRMAMTFGVVGLVVNDITVTAPGCVSKSFPDFWDKLQTVRAHARGLGDDSQR